MTHEEYEDLMQERPDGIEPLADTESLEGFSVVTPAEGRDGGMVAHRGVLQAGEYADPEVLRAAVEEHFGFTYAEITAVYKAGKPTATQREFRTYIDARILALSLSGGSMNLLADAVGLSEKTIDRALARARELYIEPQVKSPAVTRPCMCFICQSKNATPRKRRFSDSPPQWTGTVNLCGVDYTRGFEDEPGNPAYWAFRKRTR